MIRRFAADNGRLRLVDAASESERGRDLVSGKSLLRLWHTKRASMGSLSAHPGKGRSPYNRSTGVTG